MYTQPTAPCVRNTSSSKEEPQPVRCNFPTCLKPKACKTGSRRAAPQVTVTPVAIYLKRPPGEGKVLESVIHPPSPRAKQFRQEKLRNSSRGGAEGGTMFITHPCDPIGLECQEEGGRHWDAEGLKTFSISAPSSLFCICIMYCHKLSRCRM